MATIAQPEPALLPLPGGSPRAAVRLHPLLTATALAPPDHFHRAARFARLRWLGLGVPIERYERFPVPAFLIEHPGAGPVLIDTGFHPSVAVDPHQNLGRWSTVLYKDLQMKAEQAVPGQLRARGIDPLDVRLVLMTHLHPDHASAISEFQGATFVVSANEWEAATHGSKLEGYIRSQFDHAVEYRLLDFDRPETDSFATFGRALDLFGDGSVMAVSTPGHTAGHVSYVLRLAGGEALIAGDAIYSMRTLRDSHLPPRMVDEHEFRRSLREIQLYAKETPDALVVPGHDMEAWQALAPVYG